MDKVLKQKNEQYAKNVDKRGKVPSSLSVGIIIILTTYLYRKKKKNSQWDLFYLDFSYLLLLAQVYFIYYYVIFN